MLGLSYLMGFHGHIVFDLEFFGECHVVPA